MNDRPACVLVTETVREKARALGAMGWLTGLPALVGALAREWRISVGEPYVGGTEAYVARVVGADGTPAVLKVALPVGGQQVAREIAVLQLADGAGCPRLLAADVARGALLLEQLGPTMAELGLPARRRQEQLVAAARRIWRRAPGVALPTGAEHARGLASYAVAMWEELGHPCSERAIEFAVACARRRESAHDDERAVVVHGDVHQWNALQTSDGAGYKLVDPDGLLAEPELDLGILMREDPDELLAGERASERAAWLALATGLDAGAIEEWGFVERVTTGLLGTRIGLQPVARQMLLVADRLAS